MRVRLPALLALLTLAVVATGAQEPRQGDTPTFRGAVDVVELDAFVVDAAGNPVTDLTVNDFEIYEDGKKQNITSFGLINIPIEQAAVNAPPAALPRAGATDVSTNQRPEGRVYVVAVDEVSGPLVPRTRNLLRKFFNEHFADNDSAAIVYVGRGDSRQTQQFTSNRELLLRSVNSLTGGPGASDLDPSVHLLDLEGEFLVRARMHGLRMLTEFLANVHGRRKSILYVSSGLGMSVYEALDYDGGVKNIAVNELHAAITAATRGNVSIYPIDPGGLSPGGEIEEDFLSNPDFGLEVFEQTLARTDPAPLPVTPELPLALEPSRTTIGRRQDLRALAASTGGFALVDSNNYTMAFERLVRENSSYYVLGFETGTNRFDGRFHPIEIRVKRPGVEVRTRNGYLAPMRRTTPSVTRGTTLAPMVADALKSPIPVLGVPMRLHAVPFKRTENDARVAVAVEIGTDALDLVAKDGRFVGDIAVALRPITQTGKLLVGQRHEAALALKPETFEQSRNRGIRLITEMTLPPGRYQLRAAGGSKTGRAGSVIADLEIPDFSKEEFVLSGIAVTSTGSPDTTTVIPGSNPLNDVFRTPITASRDFDRSESLTLYAEAYEQGTRPPHIVDFTVDLRNEAGTVLSRFTAQKSSKDVSGPAKAYGFIAPMPLDDLQPGTYTLHIEAIANVGSKPTATRDIQIRVR